MRKRIEVTTEPAVEPITLTEAKTYLKVDGTSENALITSMIVAARKGVEQYLNRALITQTLKLTLDMPIAGGSAYESDGYFEAPITHVTGAMPHVIQLYREPVQAINSVITYNDSNTSAVYGSSNYYLNTGRLALNEGAIWGVNFRQLGALEISYDAGYGDASTDVPSGIIHGIYMYLQYMYDERIICDMPELCMNLLKPYKVYAGS